MAFSVETLRSSIGAVAQDARILSTSDGIKTAGLKHRIACCFGSTSARAANRATIDSIKMAALEDPRYSNIQDDVEKMFNSMDCRRTLSTTKIKAAFRHLDEKAFNSENGRTSFLKEEVKLRLMGQALSCESSHDHIDNDNWKYSFDSEWAKGSMRSSYTSSLPQWTEYMKRLEPLIEQRITLAAQAKGGSVHLSTSDVQNITDNIHETLQSLASKFSNIPIPERHQRAALDLTLNIIFAKPNSTYSDNNIMKIADGVIEATEELYQISIDYDSASGIVEQGIEWMNRMQAPLDCDTTLRLFARNREAFLEALKLNLSPHEAMNLTKAMLFEHMRTNGNADFSESLKDPSSALLTLIKNDNFLISPRIYASVAALMDSTAFYEAKPPLQAEILEKLSEMASENESIPTSVGDKTPPLKVGNMEISWTIYQGVGYGVIALSSAREIVKDAA